MLICLLIFQVTLVSLIILTHYMINQKYKEIEKGIKIYTSKRVYKTEENIAFIDYVIKRFQHFMENNKEMPDVDSMIKNSLLKEHIGKFTFIGVNNVAHKTKFVMWGVIALELFIAYINQVITSFQGITVIIVSILLTIIIEIFSVAFALEEKKEALIVLVEDYILNIYPLLKEKSSLASDQLELKASNKRQDKEVINPIDNQSVNKLEAKDLSKTQNSNELDVKALSKAQSSNGLDVKALSKTQSSNKLDAKRLSKEPNLSPGIEENPIQANGESYSKEKTSILTEKDIAKFINELQTL